tara:strand:- start:10366 stop:10575 length:210 start_codon:yes stop_codon:yes gene_type:complete
MAKKPIPKGKKGAGLRALPEKVVSKFGFTKEMRQGGPVNVGVREVKAILTKTKGTGKATQGIMFHKQPD